MANWSMHTYLKEVVSNQLQLTAATKVDKFDDVMQKTNNVSPTPETSGHLKFL